MIIRSTDAASFVSAGLQCYSLRHLLMPQREVLTGKPWIYTAFLR